MFTKIISQEENQSVLEIILGEGRKRQIKKMCTFVGHPTKRIKRIAFGPLRLGHLGKGKWRMLKAREIAQLKKAVGVR